MLAGETSWCQKETNPRQLFKEYCDTVIRRYRNHPRVIGWQLGNEVNTDMFHDNITFGFRDPVSYLAFVQSIAANAKTIAPDKLVVAAATTSIIQNFPNTLDFNKQMAALQDHVDAVAVHYYGANAWGLLKPGGVLDFLIGVKKPLWFTEIGTDKTNKHKSYFLKHLAFLDDKLHIEKFFWYQYDAGGSTTGYGLRTPQGVQSSLYHYIKGMK